MKTVTVRHTYDEDGQDIILVPLARGGEATLYQTDFNALLDLGISLSWNRLPNGYVVAPAAKAPGNSIQVARVIVDAGPGERLKYVNGDLTDLRSKNLCLLSAKGATRRDRDLISDKPRWSIVEYTELTDAA
jgi:hypothetical protein